jgi:signal peptide peptidase SppA
MKAKERSSINHLLPSDSMWAIERGALDRIQAAAAQILSGELDISAYDAALTSRRGRGVLSQPWAILPDALRRIEEAVDSYLRGDVVQAKARVTRHVPGGGRGFNLVNGVAVIPVQGIVTKRPTILGWFFQEAVTEDIATEFKAALSSPDAQALLFHVDSPGGMVDGTESLARLIREARGQKPIVALIDGMGASAAYWLASAADRVFIAGETTAVGSIGVVVTHVDTSKAEEMRGVKVTEIVAGKFKRIASQHEPLTPEGRAAVQEIADQLYGVFVNAVAEHRRISAEKVARTEGRLFIGTRGIEAGLVDGVRTVETVIKELAASAPVVSNARNESVPIGANWKVPTKPTASIADLERIAAQHEAEMNRRVLVMQIPPSTPPPAPAAKPQESDVEAAKRIAEAVQGTGWPPANWKR